MQTPLAKARLTRAATATLTSLISFLVAPLPGLAQFAPEHEICNSPGFGFAGPFSKTSDHSKCAGAPTQSTQTELFWVPTRLNKLCAPTGDRSAALSNIKIRIVNLYNIDSSRRLTFTGTGNAEVLVGSRGTSDMLIGGGGNDTYVVGGREASLILGPGDMLFPVSAVTEVDRIKLGASAENIYINPGPAGQENPGKLDTPIPPPPSALPGTKVSFTPRGSSAIPPTLIPLPTACRASEPGADSFPFASAAPFPFASATPFPLLAMVSRQTASSSDPWPQPLLATAAPRLAQGSKTSPGCLITLCGGDVASPSNARLYRDAFPGAPTLQGFSLDPKRADRILLPDKDLNFQGKPINEYLSSHKSLKVLVVNRVAFAPPLVVSPERLQALRENSQGLAKVRSDEAPLIYFRQNGLLVFSRNGQPLGSRENPGLIIAQLLDQHGRPLRLPITAGQRYSEATFLEFLPTAPDSKPSQDVPR